MELLKPLMKSGGIVATTFGTVFTVAGAYGLAGGTDIRFIVGIIVLLGGIALTHISFKLSRLTFLSLVLGLCFLIVPIILFGIGYSLVAGIAANVFGYLFLVTLFYWLMRG